MLCGCYQEDNKADGRLAQKTSGGASHEPSCDTEAASITTIGVTTRVMVNKGGRRDGREVQRARVVWKKFEVSLVVSPLFALLAETGQHLPGGFSH
jgi:hypothetical protein